MWINMKSMFQNYEHGTIQHQFNIFHQKIKIYILRREVTSDTNVFIK